MSQEMPGIQNSEISSDMQSNMPSLGNLPSVGSTNQNSVQNTSPSSANQTQSPQQTQHSNRNSSLDYPQVVYFSSLLVGNIFLIT